MDARGGNTLWVYSIPLNCSLKMSKMVNFTFLCGDKDRT